MFITLGMVQWNGSAWSDIIKFDFEFSLSVYSFVVNTMLGDCIRYAIKSNFRVENWGDNLMKPVIITILHST